jgi:hypothetical protein
MLFIIPPRWLRLYALSILLTACPTVELNKSKLKSQKQCSKCSIVRELLQKISMNKLTEAWRAVYTLLKKFRKSGFTSRKDYSNPEQIKYHAAIYTNANSFIRTFLYNKRLYLRGDVCLSVHVKPPGFRWLSLVKLWITLRTFPNIRRYWKLV